MPLTPEQDLKLREWFRVRLLAAEYKEQESKLRDEIVRDWFSADEESGTETIEIANGYGLKATKNLDYKLSNKEGEVSAISAILDEVLGMKLIKWTPELSVSTYKQCDAETQALFNGCLTIKPAKPTLEVVAPKAGE